MAIIGAFFEKEGVVSWTRSMMTIIIASAILIALVEVGYSLFDNSYDIHETLILSMLGIATGGKVTKKAFESKN